MRLINDTLRYLTVRYFWNEEDISYYTLPNVQWYPLPPQVDKIVNITVLIGNVLWQPRECTSRQFWDALNVIQFYQEYPYFYFIWGGKIGIWPTPTSGTDVITVNYKSRITDLTMPDVTDTSSGATLTLTNGSSTVTASGPVFVNWMAASAASVTDYGTVESVSSDGKTLTYNPNYEQQYLLENGTAIQFTDVGSYTGISTSTTYYTGSVTVTTFKLYSDSLLTSIVTVGGSGSAPFEVFSDAMAEPAGSSSSLRVPFSSSNSTSGDNQWYPISSIQSTTQATLSGAYQGHTVSGAPFSIGQVPLLMEDYQDLPLYRLGYIYYTTRTSDAVKAQAYLNLYNEGFKRLDSQFGSKSKNVVLSNEDQPTVNPNLFVPKIS